MAFKMTLPTCRPRSLICCECMGSPEIQHSCTEVNSLQVALAEQQQRLTEWIRSWRSSFPRRALLRPSVVEKSNFEKEHNLQEYIHEHPEAIPVYDIFFSKNHF